MSRFGLKKVPGFVHIFFRELFCNSPFLYHAKIAFLFKINADMCFFKNEPSNITEINFCSLTRSKSLHPLGGRWRVAPDEGCSGEIVLSCALISHLR